MYSIRCILGAVLAVALTCVVADAAVTTGGGNGVNPNPEYDTYVAQAPSGSVDTWEITLPNNTYYVTIACGDPSAATGPHYLALSGDGSSYSQIAALNTATAANEFATATNVPVTVSAGKLSLQLGGNSQANRINFIIISEDLLHNSSVCASTSFSSVQDQDHWTYNYWNGSSYGNLNTPVDGKTWTYSGARPHVSLNNGNPGGVPGALLHSVRTWTAPFDDTVNITGWALRANVPGLGDGVILRVYKEETNGTRTAILDPPITISNSDTSYHPYSITSVNILAGEKIRFHVDPIGNANADSTQFNAVVSSAAYGDAYAASNGFSSVQGQDNWMYEYFNGSTYTQLDVPVDGATWTMGGSRPHVSINNGNPGGVPGALLHSARTWTAPSNGVVDISGWALRANLPGLGDGVIVKIIKNNEATPILSESIGSSDSDYHRFTVNSVSVTAGDKLHFNVDPIGNANADSTQFDAVIQYQS